MPKRYLTPQTVGTGFLPFLDQAIELGIVNIGDSYEVVEVSETRNRSGYMVKTRLFHVLLYKSAPILEVLLEELNGLCKLNPAYSLNLELNLTSVEGFSVWFDEEESRMWSKSKKQNVLDVFQSRQIADTQKKRKAVG